MMANSPGSDDIEKAADISVSALSPFIDRDWSIQAADLSWSCHHTLDHTVSALMSYACHFASRATSRRARVREMNPSQSPPDLLSALETSAAVLAEVCRAAPDDARGFHPDGMADRSGFAAMACTEILIHTDDIVRAFQPDGPEFIPDRSLCGLVLNRLFPWAPTDIDAWDSLRWAAGRASLPAAPRNNTYWAWHCAPLAEWNGQPPVDQSH